MPRSAAAPAPSSPDAGQPLAACDRIAALLEAAMPFVAPDRGEATMRKWLPRREPEGLTEYQMTAMMADAILLSRDLLVMQPSANGSTALDRLARSRGTLAAEAAAALAALRGSRFRLLRLASDAQAEPVIAQDVMTGETVRIVGTDWPEMGAGTALFGRVAMLGDGTCCLPGAVTPLDTSALAVAHGHPAAGAGSGSAGARWAEAVYCHVVRHGTLDVPGLNRPHDRDAQDDSAEEWDFEGDTALLDLVLQWIELGEDDAPDEALLQRTRQLADLPGIIEALHVAVMARSAGKAAIPRAVERLLLVQLETVVRRERGGSGTLSLAAVMDAVDAAVAAGVLAAAAAALLATLRQRLPGAGPAADPALERLVQRIQGLRAKTVEQGCTEQEALAAAEKVAELLDRYGLSLSELDFQAQPCDGIGIQTNRRRFAPIDSCVPAIAGFFDCRVWVEQSKGAPLRYVFFGLRGDVTAAQYLYELVERAFETETTAFRAGTLYRRMAGERRSATHSFQVGLARGICDKLEMMRTARGQSRRSASGRDLVPVKAAMVDAEVDKLGLDLRQREVASGRRVLADAFSAGEAAGQRFEFIPAITRAA